jgi:DNA-binding transcriptional ArsR family regulator
LRILTQAGLLDIRREGTKRLYRIRRDAFRDVRVFLETF